MSIVSKWYVIAIAHLSVKLASADYLLKQKFFDPSCTGSIVPYREVSRGDLGVTGGCFADTATVYKKWRCLNNESAVLDSYSSSTCSGTFFKSDKQSVTFGCSSSGTLTTCVKGKYYPWTNSYQKREDTHTLNCSEVSLGSPDNIYEHRLDRCLSYVSGTSYKITYDSTSKNITKYSYSAKGCTGVPSPSLVGTIGCNDIDFLFPISYSVTYVAPSSSPLPIGASPSSTPTFVPSSFPLPSLNEFLEVSSCAIAQPISASDSFTNFACFIQTDSKKSRAMFSVLIYNPLEGSIKVLQKGLLKKEDTSVTALTNAQDVALIQDVNYVSSNDVWISLVNVTCAAIDNPSGHCIIALKGSEDFKLWVSVYISKEDTSSGSGSLIAGVAAGLIIVVIIILVVLHTMRIISVPCFNCCCDNRAKNKKHLTMTPEGAVSYPIAVPTHTYQNQTRSQVVANMHHPRV